MQPLNVLLFIILLFLITPLLGNYITAIFEGRRTSAHLCFEWLEKVCYRLGKIDPNEEMTWTHYAKAMLCFNVFGFLAVFLLQLSQSLLPLNPQQFPAVDSALAFNTAASFVTNTNWQSYAGETTLSYLTQMAGLGVQNFLSAATGMAALIALMRGITRRLKGTIGNFWVDLTRTVVYLLIPLSILMAIVLVSQGVVQTFSSYVEVTTLEKGKQVIPLGPVASQVAIKQLGTNGGGFFNTNSAIPLKIQPLSQTFFRRSL